MHIFLPKQVLDNSFLEPIVFLMSNYNLLLYLELTAVFENLKLIYNQHSTLNLILATIHLNAHALPMLQAPVRAMF